MIGLAELVETVELPGWRFDIDGNVVRFAKIAPPADRDGVGSFDGLADQFAVPAAWNADDVTARLFANLQYLHDHELREQFTVNGTRPFDPHPDDPVTGHQKDWFVERQMAVRGY